MHHRLQEIVEEEKESFKHETRKTYVAFTTKAQLSPQLDHACLIISKSPTKKYVAVAKDALLEYNTVLLAGYGENLSKVVAVAEQLKQLVGGRLLQLNHAKLTDSLINPEFHVEKSLENVLAFFAEENNQHTDEISAKRLIRGPTVYKVPVMTIVLTKEDIEFDEKWTKQIRD